MGVVVSPIKACTVSLNAGSAEIAAKSAILPLHKTLPRLLKNVCHFKTALASARQNRSGQPLELLAAYKPCVSPTMTTNAFQESESTRKRLGWSRKRAFLHLAASFTPGMSENIPSPNSATFKHPDDRFLFVHSLFMQVTSRGKRPPPWWPDPPPLSAPVQRRSA